MTVLPTAHIQCAICSITITQLGGKQYYNLDLNKDREITANEMKTYMRQWDFNEAYMQRYVTKWRKQRDTNKDGRIIYC